MIRPILKSDNSQVAFIIRQVMTEFGAVGEGYSILDPEVDEMYEAYHSDNAAFFVLAAGDHILGCGGIGPLAGGDKDTCELKKMYFLPETRGQGWGKKFVLHCLDAARSMGYRFCYLETIHRMEQANKLYQKMGFQQMPNALGCTGHSSCETYYLLEL
ncbi:MAG TPA: GNAT family N-acetyltransferase [Saprospiraceae bacterium]|nr:GNAT family N-acetyltransferase [Saprospiraceae bacterium]HMQ81325.1 GNAT family N-acetyltransferase [Saprospiraceae bacterium]